MKRSKIRSRRKADWAGKIGDIHALMGAFYELAAIQNITLRAIPYNCRRTNGKTFILKTAFLSADYAD